MAEENVKKAEVIAEEKESDGLSIVDIFFLCLNKWYWIVASVIICLIIAVLYIKTTPPLYTRSAAVLIKEDTHKSGGAVTELSELGGLGLQSNVYNEILTLKSPAVISGVVKNLGMDTDYYVEGFFYDKLLYGTTLPFIVDFIDMDNTSLGGVLAVKDKNFTLQLDYLNGYESDEVIKGQLNDTISLAFGGTMVVSNNPNYLSDPDAQPIDHLDIVKYRSSTAVEICLAGMEADLADKNADVIDLSYTDVSIERATDVVNEIIKVYNQNWLEEKNQITVSTSQFIDERLAVIEKELGSVDNSISSYKSSNRISDVAQAAGAYFARSNETSDQLMDFNNRKTMASYIRQQLTSNIAKNQLLPANSGIENPSIEKQIAEYNSNLLQRNNYATNSNEQNPLVVELDQQLAMMRKMIVASLDNYIYTLTSQINTLQRKEAISNSQLTTNPTQAKYILSVERQQKVKESLYLFLLQKREENEISQTFTAYNTRIINWAVGSDRPVAPSKNKILLIAFAVGLALPIGIIYLLESMNTRVRGRKDIENLITPYVGEIPYAMHRKKRRFQTLLNIIDWFKRKGKKKKSEEEKREIVVKDHRRDIINEAFRVVRTNLEFMLGNNGDKVVMTSSFNPGSGKTFLAMNLAVSYAIKNKRVIVVDLDLRKASLSTYVDTPKEGLTGYLNGDISDFHKVIVSETLHQNLDVMPCGKLPPNPSELLYSPRLAEMIKQLREEYDFVFLDCPPVEMLADSSIINRYVDLTLFIVRAGLLERGMLPKIDEMYKEKKYKNMALMLNGTVYEGNRYGYHKYGYYSKYGYGYGYGYGEESDASNE